MEFYFFLFLAMALMDRNVMVTHAQKDNKMRGGTMSLKPIRKAIRTLHPTRKPSIYITLKSSPRPSSSASSLQPTSKVLSRSPEEDVVPSTNPSTVSRMSMPSQSSNISSNPLSPINPSSTTNSSLSPTAFSSFNVTLEPSWNPTAFPTMSPTLQPSQSPTVPTINLSTIPIEPLTLTPISLPSQNLTFSPMLQPTLSPTTSLTYSPSTISPSISPPVSPTNQTSQPPTESPTLTPILNTSLSPPGGNLSLSPTTSLTYSPSTISSGVPLQMPIISPPVSPTNQTSHNPTESPTFTPILNTSLSPTGGNPLISSQPSSINLTSNVSLDVINCPSPMKSSNFTRYGWMSFTIPKDNQVLCTLHQISSDGRTLKPVARSYAGYEWEASSGAFSHLTWICDSSQCTINLPSLPPGSRYLLTSLSPPETYKDDGLDEIARFLEQATFGGTRADFSYFDVKNLQQSFATWIKEQQELVPSTSHREFFRQRTNSRMESATRNGAVSHPCKKGSIYRRFAFSMKDDNKYLNITSVGTKVILSIDGFVRTVVEGPITSYPSTIWPDGSYQYRRSLVNDKLGGEFYMTLPSSNAVASVYINGTLGNPKIQFDPTVGASPNILITLTNLDASPHDSKYFSKSEVTTQEIELIQDLHAEVCSHLREPGNPINPIFAFYDDSYWIHDPRFDTITNSLEAPSPDGGGKLARETQNIVHFERETTCANTERTFLNEKACILSMEPTACAYGSFDPSGGQNRPNFFIPLNLETLHGIYNVTGNGAEGTRYIYAVDGLRIVDDKTIGKPCERTSSRWISINCTGAASQLDATVQKIFSELLYYNSDNANSFLRDTWNWHSLSCPPAYMNLTGFEIMDVDGIKCWKHVHPDHLSVYDMTYWTQPDAHPGNFPTRNPIKEFAASGKSILTFPSWHSMNYWSDYKGVMGVYIGRMGDVVHYYNFPSSFRSQKLNDFFGFSSDAINFTDSKGVVVCGSPNEVKNDLTLGGSQGRGAFDIYSTGFVTTETVDFLKQKRIIWTHVALTAKDQLRQRVAWALSQILVMNPENLLGGEFYTEGATTFYDIFVRNAFGSYRNILKEVSYNVFMGGMLSYYGSKSTAYTWAATGSVQYADENYAREIMQLFTIGMFKLEQDGNKVLDSSGVPIRTYTNEDIVEYARVWTGFDARVHRGNIENYYWNHVDPMKINVAFRDIFPKMGLDRKYIGDGYPLCSDLPDKYFLKTGAKYRLLGSSLLPELITDPKKWASDPLIKRFQLQANGPDSLFAKLCGSMYASSCDFKSIVVLDRNLICSGAECSVETLRVVEVVPGIFYEYVSPPCVYQAFFSNSKAIWKRTTWGDVVCADPKTVQASIACCNATARIWNEMYWGERSTFTTAEKRCNQQLCERAQRPSCDSQVDPAVGTLCENAGYFWTNTPCTLRVKINIDGTIAIVHSLSRDEPDAMLRHVHNDTKTYFRVDWSSEGYQALVTGCDSIPSCNFSTDNICVCDVEVMEEQIYFNGQTPTPEEVLSTLFVGAFDPSILASNWTTQTENGVKVYSFNGTLTSSSVFEVTDANGLRQFRKNVKSTVQVIGTSSSFRNPVHFISLSDPALHQAQDETDAALDNYFYHPNTAPFLAIRFAQRFGISNPSPGFISRIATAFKQGLYTFSAKSTPITFGDGTYGNLGAMVACLLLDRESRTTLLDVDPMHGSLKEPLIKVTSLMRALEFDLHDDIGLIDFDVSLNTKIGQMAYAFPSVFSFFSPFFTSGILGEASLVVPEAQVMTGPRIIDFLNGLLSMIKFGLSSCYGGFGRYQWWTYYDCSKYTIGGVNDGSLGNLTFSPNDIMIAENITSELATLLTAGRLSSSNRDIVNELINSEPNRYLALLKAQQLIVMSPEFHATNIIRKSGAVRPDPAVPMPSTKSYKAIVHVFLEGGMDSFNMLIPHTCLETNSGGQTLVQQYNAERTILAVDPNERTRVINAVGQPCSQFVVNKDLEIVERLYKSGDLAFFANVGVLNQPVTQGDYYLKTKTALFAHNMMQEETERVDPYEKAPGTGMFGRMCEVLKKKGFNAQPVNVQEVSISTVGSPVSGLEPLVVSAFETNKFNPLSTGDTFELKPYVKNLNDATDITSSFYGELWSQRLQKALFDNEATLSALSSSKLRVAFSDTDFSAELKIVASLISSHSNRGTDRDVFHLSLGSWDHHSDLKVELSVKFSKLNDALTSFSEEMKAQGIWEGVTVVITSEFSRTLTANSGKGSDHAWGGHYFVMGGAVKGGKIHGSYPSDITPSGTLNIGRGRLIPTLSWESMMNGLVQWMGVETEEELDYCMPNRKTAGMPLFSAMDIFE